MSNDGDGSTPNTVFVLSNDSRLTDARVPITHHTTHTASGSDPLAPADIGAASLVDLRYRLVESGKWEFSGLPEDEEFPWSVLSGPTLTTDGGGESIWKLVISNGQDPDLTYESAAGASQDDLTIELRYQGQATITATRASLPGNLLDRAVNTVNVSTTTILTLPASQYEDKARNLYVNFNIQDSA